MANCFFGGKKCGIIIISSYIHIKSIGLIINIKYYMWYYKSIILIIYHDIIYLWANYHTSPAKFSHWDRSPPPCTPHAGGLKGRWSQAMVTFPNGSHENVEKIGNYGALDGFGGPFFFKRHHSAAEKSHRKVHPFSAQTSSKPQDVRWDRPSALRVRRGWSGNLIYHFSTLTNCVYKGKG